MFRGLRRHVTYANVVATMALVFAMGGTAIAAKHYLITSTRQIKPSVLKSLKGGAGPKGSSGLQGAPGKEGLQGKEGPTGHLTTTLPSGETLRGSFNFDSVAAGANQLNGASISFGVTLPSAPAVEVVPGGGPATVHCPGSVSSPSSTAGYLCLYEVSSENLKALVWCNAAGTCGGSADAFGLELFAESVATGRFYVDGSWAVTAP
jgi:hypothetical protein